MSLSLKYKNDTASDNTTLSMASLRASDLDMYHNNHHPRDSVPSQSGDHRARNGPGTQSHEDHRSHPGNDRSGPARRRRPSGLTFSIVANNLSNLIAATSGLYAMALVSVYVAFSFTEIVNFRHMYQFLELNGFFLYLYVVSDMFLVYVLAFALKRSFSLGEGSSLNIVENHKSHGSLAIRLGVVFFGLGTLANFVLELIDFYEIEVGSPCYKLSLPLNVFAAIVFVILQTVLVFVYPRINLHINVLIDRFGTMHIVCTNIILWIRTLVKESLHEIVEESKSSLFGDGEEEAHERPISEAHHESSVAADASVVVAAHAAAHADADSSSSSSSSCNSIIHILQSIEKIEEDCQMYHTAILGEHTLRKASPFLFPFVIEFALIGASVFFIMWRHVRAYPARPSLHEVDSSGRIRLPHPKAFVRKSDWSHSGRGLLCGLAIFVLAMINLFLFFFLDGHEDTRDEAELLSKASNSIINFCALVGLVYGLLQVTKLEPVHAEDVDADTRANDSLDLALLRFTAFFAYLYLAFTVITGAFNNDADFPNWLHAINGIIEAAQITLQIVFIIELKLRDASNESASTSKQGRQVTMFLFLFNLAQWCVFTFEIQKVRASVVEAEFYGFMSWVLIQRITLPLTVFFRFHSAVVCIEMWKEIYEKKE